MTMRVGGIQNKLNKTIPTCGFSFILLRFPQEPGRYIIVSDMVFFIFFCQFKKYRKLLKSTNVILKSTANIDQQDTDYANDDNTFDVVDTISINEGRDGDNDDRFPKIQFPFFEALK